MTLTSAALILVVTIGPGLASADVTTPPPTPERSVVNGEYRLEGTLLQDSCGGLVTLAARHIRLAPRDLRADVVDRVYPRRSTEDPGRLVVAAGTFNENGNRLDELWTLRAVATDHLEGTLVSTWRFAGKPRPCTVTFHLEATRQPSSGM